MASSLTGDFDAVLQVSGGTLARLLASMHQNSGPSADAATPSFPHGIAIRVGDPQPIEEVSGTVWAQVGVPRVTLVDASTDRFRIAVGVRARFRSDAGSYRLPELISGELRAEYRLERISDECPGYRQHADDFLWPRVVTSSVVFDGIATDDLSMLSVVLVEPPDEEEALRRITRICAVLLRTTFAPVPQRVSPRFRRGRMRTLNRAGGTAIAIPLGLGAEAPAGAISSVDRVVLEGADLALAIAADAVLGQIQPRLDQLRASFTHVLRFTHKSYVLGVKVVDIDIAWRVSLTSADVEWLGPAPLMGDETGVLAVRLKGQADTADPDFDIGFEVTQFLSLGFDAAGERIVASAVGGPSVTIHASGSYADEIRAYAKPQVEQQVKAQVAGLLAQAGALVDLTARREELVAQLRTFDGQADARLVDAQFTTDGLVLRGPVRVAPRRRAQIAFTTTGDRDGFTAFDSWLPGGRIDRLEWEWEWFNGAGEPGSDRLKHTFLLRRPFGLTSSKFGGLAGLRKPLPGVDGMGRVCLTVSGVRVDTSTGALVPFVAAQKCRRYGWDFRGPPDLSIDKYLVHEPFPGPGGGLVVDLLGPTVRDGINVLVIGAGELWDAGVGDVVKDALTFSRRRNTSLLVLVLVAEGLMDRQLQEKLAAFGRTLEAPLLASEDVGGRWAAALRMEPDAGRLAWRLVTPTGGLSWRHDGELDAESLASTIDVHLFTTPKPVPRPIDPWVEVGTVIPPMWLDPGLLLPDESHCPPVPVGRLAAGPSTVLFVRKGSSADALRPLVAEHAPALVAVVVDGAEDVGDLEGLGEHVVAIADPLGAVAARFGVRAWPTTLSADALGAVDAVRSGPVAVAGEAGA